MKKVTIEVPDDMDFDPDKFEYELVKKEKKSLCYGDIAKRLFSKGNYYINACGIVQHTIDYICYSDPNNCTSEKQGQKLLALNKLMNVAKYLNDGWTPNWDDNECKYYLCISNNEVIVTYKTIDNTSFVYFSTMKLAQQAIEILGEDTIKLALSTYW